MGTYQDPFIIEKRFGLQSFLCDMERLMHSVKFRVRADVAEGGHLDTALKLWETFTVW